MISIPILDLQLESRRSLSLRFISNCQFLGVVMDQGGHEKIVQLFEQKDLMRENTSDEQTWTRRIFSPRLKVLWDETGHLNIDMNTISIVYADLSFFKFGQF